MRKIPSLRRHKPTSQAVVTLSGKDHYLGVWPVNRRTAPADIQLKYERIVAEWLAEGRRIAPRESPWHGVSNDSTGSPASMCDASQTVAEVLAAYWDHAERYYRGKDGNPSPELACLRAAFRPLRDLFDDLPAIQFSPKKLSALREHMIRAGLARTTINYHVGRIKRMFRWAAAQELVTPSIYHGLQSLDGLRAGRSDAGEPRPVRPVTREAFERTILKMPPMVAAMAEVQLLTGMRSGEVCCLRPADLDRSADVWVYRPVRHKTAHHGKDRAVPIGPRAQAILQPLIAELTPEEFVFSPSRAEKERHARRSEVRRTPRYPSHMARNRRKRKARPVRAPKDRYCPTSFARCVTRACEKAFPLPATLARITIRNSDGTTRLESDREWKERLGPDGFADVERWRTEHHWSPHQLRHLKATEVRRNYGLDAAQVVLGHAKASVTEIYAEADLKKAAEIAHLTG